MFILRVDVSEAWGLEGKPPRRPSVIVTRFNACKTGCCRGAGAHRVTLSLSLRQLSSNEGAVARSIVAHQKSTLRKRGNFEVMLVLQVRKVLWAFSFFIHTFSFSYFPFHPFFPFFFHLPQISSFYLGKGRRKAEKKQFKAV